MALAMIRQLCSRVAADLFKLEERWCNVGPFPSAWIHNTYTKEYHPSHLTSQSTAASIELICCLHTHLVRQVWGSLVLPLL